MSTMCEWNVYVNGKYVGTVHETSESLARCAAMYKFDTHTEDELSVSKR